MNRTTTLFLILLCFFSASKVCGQSIALKNNLLYDVTATPNLGLEFGIAPRWTIDLPVSYNPFTFSGNKKIKHLLVQPEARYWLCERFNGHFFGLQLTGGIFNVGGLPLPGLDKQYRYEGWAAGAGFTYGYQWMIGRRWNLEASLGVGYIRTQYNKYECPRCGKKLESDLKGGFVAPTKAAISIIYLIK